MKCLACGSKSLVRGTIYDSSDSGKSAFKFDDVSIWKSVFGIGTRVISAYGCVHCGHLQLTVDFNEKDRQRYQQFDGEQPGVLERLTSETDNSEN